MSVLSLPFRSVSVLTRLAVAGLTVATAGSALTLLASPAHAVDTLLHFSWSGAGTHYVTVPDNAVSLTINTVGGAGADGQQAGGAVSKGGAGGGGAALSTSYELVSNGVVKPGDHLEIVIGAAGAGKPGGSGDGPGGSGGAGGGATFIVNTSRPNGGLVLTVAGGGGGGGGGGGQFFQRDGGAGGSASDGLPGLALGSGGAGRGGALGSRCDTPDVLLTFGDDAESASSASAAGGGGGAGQGACGGQGGGSGDHAGLGGGGGGGAGYSLINGTAVGTVNGTTQTGDGSAELIFTEDNGFPQLVASAAALPSTATVGKAYNGSLTASGGDLFYQWSPSGGDLPPGLSLTAAGNITGTPTEAGKFLFVARVADSESTPQYADVVVTLTVNPPPIVTVALPDLSLSLSHGRLIKGSVQPFRFAVRNVGAIPTANPSMSITLPAGLNPQSATGIGWTCQRSGQSYTCNHAAMLAPGKSSVVTIRARVTAPVKTVLTTTASVSVAPADANPANNSVTNTTPVVAK